nr:vegetative cell wall protein gp1-like [Aegilops tauschii subsp. strangulata]
MAAPDVRDPAGRICSSSPSPTPQVPPAGASSPPLPRAKSSARTIPLLPASLHRAMPLPEFLAAGNRLPNPRTARIRRARGSPASASRLCPSSASPCSAAASVGNEQRQLARSPAPCVGSDHLHAPGPSPLRPLTGPPLHRPGLGHGEQNPNAASSVPIGLGPILLLRMSCAQ